MSRNGSGTYNLPAGNPVVTGNTISSSWANTTLSDIASALTDSLAADGQTTASGNLNMGTNRITNLADGTTSSDAASVAQVTSAVAITGGTINGTTIGATTPSTGEFTRLTIDNFAKETVNIVAGAPSSTTNFDIITSAVQYYTSNATTNFTLNLRGNSGTSLNSIMSTGESATIALFITCGATAYYPTAFTIDGTSVTPKWQGASAPTAGYASSVNVYAANVLKTADATFTVFVSQTQFA
jgi:hypothetical protein